jgi:putative SOS response-associated peptidase YedK
MCNEYQREVPVGEIADQFSHLKIKLNFPEGVPNLAPTSIRISDTGTIIRAAGEAGAAELVQRRWSWPGPTGKPVFNYRSEGREFSKGRCLIVANGFFEFTSPSEADGGGKSRKKQKWLFTKSDEPWFCIAGLWRTDEKVGEAYTMLTAAPGPDVAPYHDRQVAVLHRHQWQQWLDPAAQVKGLLGPLPEGSLQVQRVA